MVVVFDTVYSTETILAKVRGGLKDTEVNVRLRPGSTIHVKTAPFCAKTLTRTGHANKEWSR